MLCAATSPCTLSLLPARLSVCLHTRIVYGGADLTQTNGIFLDSAFGLGYNFRTLNQVGCWGGVRGTSMHMRPGALGSV